ncbi:ubiquinol-cytochrome C chaperone family protein [Novosphingobium flavum]|uniref:Ubiquinol-cytochrome C chaperone family protein n=1 Tax=Novosphingobium flavum TaxID=1778672 RepID=A0A7X1FS93_9SPHN|nr:ubiquinol-cytochrome C chaperone family protein [Novosphingobium flavum]MBC2666034.1 ubiquinol-cytochrome C chaperone family protein [Novosphingobium flavum]
MGLLSRLLNRPADDRAPYRPLWHRTVELARDKRWYAEGGIADTVPGRFDAITLTLAAVLLRMEREEALVAPSVRLTELFVDDMDGQLRESGVGDLVVGKHMGKLMSVLGGRLGALREALALPDDTALTEAITRNITLGENGAPATIAALLRSFATSLDGKTAEDLLAARIELPESV